MTPLSFGDKMIITENTSYMTILGGYTINSPKFNKSKIKTKYLIQQWLYNECLRINTLLYESMDCFNYDLNNIYQYNLSLLKAYPKKSKNFSAADVNMLTLILFGTIVE